MATPRLYGALAKTLVALLTIGAVPDFGAASQRCEQHVLAISTQGWAGPLSRSVSVESRSLTLRAALDRLAAAAQLRVSYSAEQLPLAREVCISYKGVALGDALTDLLKGVAVEPIVAGTDHIVLAPTPARAASERDPQPLVPLSPIVATASANNPQRLPPSYAFSVLDHELVAQHGSVAQALSAGVPGVWAWTSPTGLTTLYSVRGASSFGASSPKIYIDGIEVANPLLVTQLLPENIERIEVIRGPQGGALYGGDAISGVTNIVTRHESVVAGAPRLRVRSGLAVSGSAFMPGAGVGQDHTIALQVGSPTRSGALNFGLGSVGEFMPGAFARHLNFDGSMRLVGSRTVITGTARLVNHSTGNPFGLPTDSAFDATAVSLRQYTLGARAVVRQSERVTHAIVLGVDGYTLSDLPSDSFNLSLADSVLRAAGSDALRTTARISSVARFDVGPNVTSAVTLSAEHSNLRQEGELERGYYEPWTQSARRQPAGSDPNQKQPLPQHSVETYDDTYFELSRSSNGLSAQLDAAFFERASVAAALRVEQNQVNGSASGTTTLPMLAASYLAGSDAFNVKLRASYGKAVRWPEMPNRIASWSHGSRVLTPEQQAGMEAGVDVGIGRFVQLQLTRYDQIASGLVQCVAVSGPGPGPGTETGTRLQLQNVGEIENRGWEVMGTMRRGSLALTGALALTDSRVQRVAVGYTGDLRAGDRMLGVPARTVSLSASWLGSEWSTSLTAYRAHDWVGYDRIALTQANQQPLLGSELRNYWQQYDGSTHLRATLTRNLNPSLKLYFTGDNLLGNQTGEPDNLTVLPGRTLSFGVKAAF